MFRRFMIMSVEDSGKIFNSYCSCDGWRMHIWFVDTKRINTHSVVIGSSQNIRWTLSFCLFLIDLWIVYCYVLQESLFFSSFFYLNASATRCSFYATCAVVAQQQYSCIECIWEWMCLLFVSTFYSISVVVFIWIKCYLCFGWAFVIQNKNKERIQDTHTHGDWVREKTLIIQRKI